ncbi:NADH dehydrogenase [ubiquinone] 1 beta subcomplex subunit 3-B-like [Phaseolus vulgaris]
MERKKRGGERERELEEEMGSGKNTAEFFRRRDAWRKHPLLTNQFRHATPGLGIALVAFGFYLVGEQVYDRLNADSHAHVKAENHH